MCTDELRGSARLMDAVAESNACEEALYYIRKLLDRERITLEEYLKVPSLWRVCLRGVAPSLSLVCRKRATLPGVSLLRKP
jgi:hypothetical protein